jgi:hypothetical protein
LGLTGFPEAPAGLRDYVNIPATIGTLLSQEPLLISALSTTLSVEDMYDLLEVYRIDGYNRQIIRREQEKLERKS